MNAILQRAPVQTIALDLARLEAFGKEVLEKFGYSKITQTLAAKRDHMALAIVLQDMKLCPFTEKSVNKYKKHMETKMWWTFLDNWGQVFGFGMFVVSVALTIMAVVHAVTVSEIPDMRVTALQHWGRFGMFVLSLASWITFGLTCNAVSNAPIVKLGWRREALRSGGYSGIVPMAVLQQALEIQKKHPSVILEVDALRSELSTKSQYDYLDPFLVARIGSAAAYIAVWDEPDYDQELI